MNIRQFRLPSYLFLVDGGSDGGGGGGGGGLNMADNSASDFPLNLGSFAACFAGDKTGSLAIRQLLLHFFVFNRLKRQKFYHDDFCCWHKHRRRS